MEILPGIHRIEQRLGERYLYQYVLLGERALLLDTGIASSPVEVIYPALIEIGIAPESLSTVLITHADVDHCGGNAAIKRLLPQADLVAHKGDQAWIESKERILAERYGWYAAHELDYDPDTKAWIRENLGTDTPLDRAVSDGEWLDLVGRRVQLLHLPGHSPGHMGVWDPQTRTALIGDAVLERGLYDVAGKRIGPPPYFVIASYLETIERLNQLAPEHLLTAHYPAMHSDAVSRFLLESRDFVTEMGQAVEEILRSARKPLPLKDLTAQVDARVGPYVSFTNELAGPVRAHTEALVTLGRARQTEVDGRTAWEWIDNA